MTVYEGPLGMIPPSDNRHQMRYGLTAGTMPSVPTPVVLGSWWFPWMDRPTVDSKGKYWIRPAADWGKARGGHCYCLKPPGVVDYDDWWMFYNQGNEGACVGFGWSRAMTLLNRKRYDARPLYLRAQQIDEWPGENYSGTSVRAGGDVVRDEGMWVVRRGGLADVNPTPSEGIRENRWAGSVEEIAACLSPSDNGSRVLNLGFVDILNSWGRGYPHFTRLDLEHLHRLIFVRDGEATVITDEP